MTKTSLAEQDWTFGGTWPYQPRWFDSVDGRMHYIDEGPRNGRPIVMVHGNPTWGYLYRHFIAALTQAGYRAIALDHLGFGRSEKPDNPKLYQIPRHGGRCEALLESLNLQDVTIIVQDWGGPIGLTWAARHPERVCSLVLLNTFAHRPPEKVALPLPLRLFRQSPLTINSMSDPTILRTQLRDQNTVVTKALIVGVGFNQSLVQG